MPIPLNKRDTLLLKSKNEDRKFFDLNVITAVRSEVLLTASIDNELVIVAAIVLYSPLLIVEIELIVALRVRYPDSVLLILAADIIEEDNRAVYIYSFAKVAIDVIAADNRVAIVLAASMFDVPDMEAANVLYKVLDADNIVFAIMLVVSDLYASIDLDNVAVELIIALRIRYVIPVRV